MKKYFTIFTAAVLCLIAGTALWTANVGAATSVILAPIPQFYATDTSGRPLASGCVFTYVSGTTTPLATYTDSTGVTLNPNPVILSSAGNANIWIQAGQAYSFRVKSAGGSSCVSGSTRYTVNGIGGGASQLSSNVSSSATPQFTAIAQNQLFLFTLSSSTVALPLVVTNVQPPSLISFQITENPSGGWSFAWPANVIGGGTVDTTPGAVNSQSFLWNGTNAIAIGPLISGQSAGGAIVRSGDSYVTGNQAVSGNDTVGGTESAAGYKFTAGQTANGFSGSAGTKIVTSSAGLGPAAVAVCGTSTGDAVSCGVHPAFVYRCSNSGACGVAPHPGFTAVYAGQLTLVAGAGTITGMSFTAASTFQCTASDVTTAGNGANAVPASATTATVTGTGTDVIQFICTGG